MWSAQQGATAAWASIAKLPQLDERLKHACQSMAQKLGAAKSAAEVRALLKDADVSATDYFGKTALHWAAIEGAPAEVITALLEAGADASATNEEGITPAILAEAEGQLLAQQEAAEIAPALMLAEGVGPFAIQIAGVPTFPIAGEDTSVSLEVGGQLEFDFAALTAYFPIALAGGYAMDYRFTGSDITHQVTGGLLYSGRRDLSLGLIAGYAPDPTLTLITGTLALQYFF